VSGMCLRDRTRCGSPLRVVVLFSGLLRYRSLLLRDIKKLRGLSTSGAAENVFWSAMPAMALFAVSGALLAFAAILAAFNALSRGES
jgi:hypothetical protein